MCGYSDHYAFDLRKDKDVLHSFAAMNLLVKVSIECNTNILNDAKRRFASTNSVYGSISAMKSRLDSNETSRLLALNGHNEDEFQGEEDK